MTAAVADPAGREFLRNADPVLARVIDAHPGFRPRAWLDELPRLDAFGTLIFQVAGQQLSVRSTRAIVSRLERSFGGHLPSPDELLAADPQILRASGLSARKRATLRALAERFADGRLSDTALARMTDDEIEAALTEVSGIPPPATLAAGLPHAARSRGHLERRRTTPPNPSGLNRQHVGSTSTARWLKASVG